MRRWKYIFSIIAIAVCVLLVFQDIFAGTGRRRGTAGAQELLIPVGSVGTALGGANLATTSGIEAMYWNPAGLAATQSSAEVMISHLQYIADMDVNYIAGSFLSPALGALGVSIKTVGFGDIAVTTNDSPDGTGEMYSPTFMTLGATYSRAMTNKIYFGASAKFISEKIMRQTASAVAFDFGLQYNTGMGLRGAVCLKNIGSNIVFDGSDLEVFTTDISDRPDASGENIRIPLAVADMPTTFEIALSYEYAITTQNHCTFMGSFMNDNYALDEYRVGLEYNFNNLVFLRGSYQLGFDADEDKFRTADPDNFLWGPSFGGGINLNLGPSMKLNLDYAYRLAEIFDDNQWFSLRLSF